MTEFSTILKCQYFPLCSGCSFQGDVSLPPIMDVVRKFFQSAAPHVPFSLTTGAVTGWRTRSKLAVRGTVRDPQIGLFKFHSHDVVSIPTCPLHHPSINSSCAKIKTAMIEHKIEPYDEQRGSGTLRYLQFAVDRKTGDVQLTLVVNHKNSFLDAFVQQLYRMGGFHSIWLNFQPEQVNRIFGEEWAHLQGEEYLWERLRSADCAFHPACFAQANLSLFEAALDRICNWVIPDAPIVELYSGIGAIGLNLVSTTNRVTCVEINPYALQCFELIQQKLPLGVQGNISMRVSSSEDAADLIAKNRVIIVDPPRKGLDAKVLDALCKANVGTQLIYLSCGPRSFQRDAEKLLAHGWKIENTEAFLFFPGTDHVEVLCDFKKESG